MPKVSVIIPTYNSSKFICDAIDSVLNQNYRNFEIIIIDDGSTDDTKEKLIKYESKINYYYKKNGGPASARNYGVQRSQGEYICFLDADDIFLPKKLEIQVSLLDQYRHAGIGLLYSDFFCIDEYDYTILKYYKCKDFSSHKKALQYLYLHNYINTSTVMVKKDYINQIGLFDEELRYLEDYDLWIRLGMEHEFYHIAKPLVKTRSYTNSYRKKISNTVKKAT